MKVRVIKSEDCPICKTYLSRLVSQKFDFESYDGDDPAHQADLDRWGITDYPVVQILDEAGQVQHQFPRGTYSPLAIRHAMNQLSKAGVK